MQPRRKLSRRSFMVRVMGGVAAGGALGLIGGEGRAWQPPETGITDSDTGSNSDNAGYGRGGHHAISDNDSGPRADHAGHGRNMRSRPQHAGLTDGDASDPRGGGRGGHTGYSDTDSGPYADRSGHGRPTGRHRANAQGLCTDSDFMPPRDSTGHGRHC